jgi:hypothetical protein
LASRAAASRIASSRRRRKASSAASSAPVGSSPFRLGQEQARLQVGEPGGHDQIIGGELEAQAAGSLDEGEILLGERQDRDAGDVDLLARASVEQQIERPLEAVDVDDQRRLGVAAVERADRSPRFAPDPVSLMGPSASSRPRQRADGGQ